MDIYFIFNLKPIFTSFQPNFTSFQPDTTLTQEYKNMNAPEEKNENKLIIGSERYKF